MMLTRSVRMLRVQLKKVTDGTSQRIYLYLRLLVDVQLHCQEFRFAPHHPPVALIAQPTLL
ncbi:hypothetical protein ALO96_200135 [Pseudomonas savastanoi pv. glycinea]|nr:hypothetical protein ALO96_200135 [Pseudomonas savastanoi pv. glycinea]